MADEVELTVSGRRALQEQVMLFYTGVTRSADTILSEQNANVESHPASSPPPARSGGLRRGRAARAATWTRSGPAIRDGWEAKRKLASGCPTTDRPGGRTGPLTPGASGAKVTGAGGGGFLLAICPIERQRAVRESLTDMRELPIKLDPLGSRVVLNVLRDIWG